MPYDYNLGGQGALSGAIGGAQLGSMAMPGIGTAVGGILGGALGALGGIGGEQEIPDFNAAEMANNYLERFGGFEQEQKQIEANANSVMRQTVSDLIASGADPISARNVARQRANEFRANSVSELIDSARRREAQLTQQLLPTEIQRGEDQASLKNLQSAQRQENMMSWGPSLIGAGLTVGEMFGQPGVAPQGGGRAADYLTGRTPLGSGFELGQSTYTGQLQDPMSMYDRPYINLRP